MYTARFPRDPKHGGQALARPVTCPKLGEYLAGKQSFLPKLQARLAAYKPKGSPYG